MYFNGSAYAILFLCAFVRRFSGSGYAYVEACLDEFNEVTPYGWHLDTNVFNDVIIRSGYQFKDVLTGKMADVCLEAIGPHSGLTIAFCNKALHQQWKKRVDYTGTSGHFQLESVRYAGKCIGHRDALLVLDDCKAVSATESESVATATAGTIIDLGDTCPRCHIHAPGMVLFSSTCTSFDAYSFVDNQ